MDILKESKLPPQQLDLEEAVLSAILIESSAMGKVYGIISSDSFYLPKHQAVYKVMQALYREHQPIDLLTVMERAEKMGLEEMSGGPAYLAQLASKVTSSANIEYHSRIIQEKFMLRTVIRAGSEMANAAFSPTADGPGILNEAHNKVMSLMLGMAKKNIETSMDVGLKRAKYYAQVRDMDKGQVNGVTTGLKSLDDWTGGMKPGKLYIIAARPAMGKTSLIMSCIRNQAIMRGIPVGMFSLEMPNEELYDRILSQEAHLSSSKIQDTRLCSEDEYIHLMAMQERVDTSPLFMDDTPGLDIMELRSKAREMARRGAKAIYLDYIQLAKATMNKNSTRAQEVGTISRSLKEMAKELGLPVIALSQLSRAVEETKDKRPEMRHLKESGSLEEDADFVAFLYRPEYYGIKKGDDPLKGYAEFIISKNRGGPTGMAELSWVSHLSMFKDATSENEEWL